MDTVERGVAVIHACFLLHNIAEKNGDFINDDDIADAALFPADVDGDDDDDDDDEVIEVDDQDGAAALRRQGYTNLF